MAYTDFIAAIDLGTSHIVGMVGTKNASGALSILAYEVEKAEGSIRRGCVYNGEEVAYHIGLLLRKLENKLDGAKIDKVYIGIGGQSLRSMDYTVNKVLGSGGEVTEAILQEMAKDCRMYRPAELDVFDIISPAYYLDGRAENEPLGVNCSRIDAKYKLIVGRPVLRRSIENTVKERIKRKVPRVLVSPIALANLVLTDAERQQGGILIDFGAGVTSVSAYRKGRLQMLYVVPFGSHLITRDIASGLDVSESEAERLKRVHGMALPNKEIEQQPLDINRMDGVHTIKQTNLDEIVEARVREIIENVYARVQDSNILKDGGYSIVIAGGGAMLKDLREAVKSRFKMDVRIASARRDLIEGNDMIANNPEYMLAAALLLQCEENCAEQPEVKVQTSTFVKPKVEPKANPAPTQPKQEEKKVEAPQPDIDVEAEEQAEILRRQAAEEEQKRKEKERIKRLQEEERRKGPTLWGKIWGKIEQVTEIKDKDY